MSLKLALPPDPSAITSQPMGWQVSVTTYDCFLGVIHHDPSSFNCPEPPLQLAYDLYCSVPLSLPPCALTHLYPSQGFRNVGFDTGGERIRGQLAHLCLCSKASLIGGSHSQASELAPRVLVTPIQMGLLSYPLGHLGILEVRALFLPLTCRSSLEVVLGGPLASVMMHAVPLQGLWASAVCSQIQRQASQPTKILFLIQTLAVVRLCSLSSGFQSLFCNSELRICLFVLGPLESSRLGSKLSL